MKRIPLREAKVGDAVGVHVCGDHEYVCRVESRINTGWIIVSYDHGSPPTWGGPQVVKFALPSDTSVRPLPL